MSNQLTGWFCGCLACRVAELVPCDCSKDKGCPLTYICNVPQDVWAQCLETEGTLVVSTGGCCYELHCSNIPCPEGADNWNDYVWGFPKNCESSLCCEQPCSDDEDCCSYPDGVSSRPLTVRYRNQHSMGFSVRGDYLGNNAQLPECGEFAFCNSTSGAYGPAMDCGGAPAAEPPYEHLLEPGLKAKPLGIGDDCVAALPPTPPKWICLEPNCKGCAQQNTCGDCGPYEELENWPQVYADGMYHVIEYTTTSPPMDWVNCERQEIDNRQYVTGNYRGYGPCDIPITYIDHHCIGYINQNSGDTPFVAGCPNGWPRMGCTGQGHGPCPGCTEADNELRTPGSAGDVIGNTTTTTVGVNGTWECQISIPYGLNNYCLGGKVIQTVKFTPDLNDPNQSIADPWEHTIVWEVPDGVDARLGCSGISEVYDPEQAYIDRWAVSPNEAAGLFDYYGYLEARNFLFELPYGAAMDNDNGPFGCGSNVSPNTPITNYQPFHGTAGGSLTETVGMVTGPNYIYQSPTWDTRTFGENITCPVTGEELFQTNEAGRHYKKAYAAGIL